ncbi:MAG: hypothetical protein JEZ06_23510 [Anaerolineaceae bacterium]|nr:hypothetical protein [Anaerolineaceae bacterium]
MYFIGKPRKISKILSKNDSGETGGHQAGILVPKDRRILDFFPDLGTREKNPRTHMSFKDDTEQEWVFAFIYYNSALFGGTRNEYRLTRMTQFLRVNDLKEGDEIIFFINDQDDRRITFSLAGRQKLIREGVLRIGKNWKVINM